MKIGQSIPETLGVDQQGRLHKAADYAGKGLII